MIDNQLRQIVQSEIEAIAPDQGDLADVLRRGRRRRRTRYVTQTLGITAAVGLIGIAGLLGSRTVQVPGVAGPEEAADLSLVVVDGDGPGELADRLALDAGPPVVPGSAIHLGSVTVGAGRLDIISHRSIGGNPRFPNAEGTCYAVVSEEVDWGEAVCRYDPSEVDGIGYGLGDDGYTFFHDSPEETFLATVTTANGKTIDIETASTTSRVFALWELSWGPPAWVDFKDEQGNLIERLSFDDIEAAPASQPDAMTLVSGEGVLGPAPVAEPAGDEVVLVPIDSLLASDIDVINQATEELRDDIPIRSVGEPSGRSVRVFIVHDLASDPYVAGATRDNICLIAVEGQAGEALCGPESTGFGGPDLSYSPLEGTGMFWGEVPSFTSYAAVDVGGKMTWQRPIDNLIVLPFTATLSDSVRLTLHDETGRRFYDQPLGESFADLRQGLLLRQGLTWVDELGLSQTDPTIWRERIQRVCAADPEDSAAIGGLAAEFIAEDLAASAPVSGRSEPTPQDAAQVLANMATDLCPAAFAP